MTREQHNTRDTPTQAATNPARRDFMARSIAAGIAVAGGSALAAESVVETDVTIKLRDGTCDAAFLHPASGSHAAVLIWPDALGLRPTMRSMARRLAAEGYAVLVPNPFYRVSKAPQFDNAANIDFGDKAVMGRITALMNSVSASGAAHDDAIGYVAFLDAQPQVDRARKVGVQGYCMGGALTLRTAAAVPGRVGAAASFHGGRLVTDAPDSPHLLAPKIKARVYIAIASNDDQRQPDAKTKLKDAFAKAHVPAEVEVYPAKHGWCVPDMPAENGAPIYSAADAERAWAKLLALYKQALG